MKKVTGLLLAIVMVLALAACGSQAPATTAATTAAGSESSAEDTTAAEEAVSDSEETTEAETATEEEKAENAMSVIVGSYSMMEVKTITDDSYAGLYGDSTEEGAAKQAVMDIIAAGKATINGFVIPASVEEFEAEYPDGYMVNGDAWLSVSETGAYKVDRNEYEDFAEAAVALITRIPAGNEIILIDEDEDGFYDTIDALYRAAFIVNAREGNKFERAEISAGEGKRAYDGELAAYGTGLEAADVVGDPQVGDMVFAMETPDGWVVEEAYPVTGKLVEGIDHEYYQIDDTKYDDAMRFSRDNIVISNRCGEFTNALKYFGMTGEGSEIDVTLWFVKPEYLETLGAPAGFTSEQSATILENAIAQANAKIEENPQAPEEAVAELTEAISNAQAVLDDSASAPDQMTYQVYLLYLTLHGSQDDIGASFAGYEFAGFDNQIQ